MTPAVAHGSRFAVPRAYYGRSRSLCAPPHDTVGPSVSKVTFTKASIDLNSGSLRQTVHATASDTSGNGSPTGVLHVVLAVRGPHYYFKSVTLALTSGTPESGRWTGHFAMSKYARPGTYSLENLAAYDRAGNMQNYPGYGNGPESPSALSLHPDDNPTFTVTGTPATPPARKPAGTLRSFSFSPAGVNTTKTVRYTHVVAHFAGAEPARVWATFVSVKSAGLARYAYQRAALRRTSVGWVGAVQIPRWLGNQTLEPYLFVVYGSRYQPDFRNYTPDELAQRQFPTKLTVVSGVDHSKPTLSALRITPSSIDSTNGPEQVTVTARASDVGSGVRYIYVNGGIRHGLNGVPAGAYPFAAGGVGYQSSEDIYFRLKRVSGNKWQGTRTVPRCVPSGTYKLTVSLSDVAGNYHYYSTKALAAAHLPSRVDVTSEHGDVEQPYVYTAATDTANKYLLVDFSEGVANVNTSTLSVYPLTRRNRYKTPATVDAITCYNGRSVVDCSGAAGLVTSAHLTIPSLTPGVLYDIYANQNQVTPQLTDGNRNPMDWNYSQYQVQGA